MINFSKETLNNLYRLGLIDYECVELFSNPLQINPTLGGTILGGVGGFITAKKLIKEREEQLGRPLTKEEKQKIYLMGIGGGTAVGLASGHAVGKLVKNDTGSRNAVGKKVDSVFDLYNKALRTKGRLEDRYLKGISFEDQDNYMRIKQETLALAEAAKHKSVKDMTETELNAIDKLKQHQYDRGSLRQAMLVGGGLLALNNVIKPLYQEYKQSKKGAKYSQEELIKVAQDLRSQGKSTKEIEDQIRKLMVQ